MAFILVSCDIQSKNTQPDSVTAAISKFGTPQRLTRDSWLIQTRAETPAVFDAVCQIIDAKDHCCAFELFQIQGLRISKNHPAADVISKITRVGS